MTCTIFSLNSRNRSASGALPHNPHRNSACGPSWRTSIPQTAFIHVCPPLVQFLNTPLCLPLCIWKWYIEEYIYLVTCILKYIHVFGCRLAVLERNDYVLLSLRFPTYA